MSTLAIVETFSELPDPRRRAGCRHEYAVCLALFTLAISAGCGGFLVIGDGLKAYRSPLIALFYLGSRSMGLRPMVRFVGRYWAWIIKRMEFATQISSKSNLKAAKPSL